MKIMNITSSIIRGTVPVTVLHLDGRMDGSNYQNLIDMAQEQYESGARNLLLDLGKLSFISSAGISALHRTALIFSGKKAAEMEEGWAAFRAMDRDRDRGKQQHVKLLNPNEEIRRVLDTVGFSALFEIHDALKEAVDSFL
jgi:anti-anti-sigma factor